MAKNLKGNIILNKEMDINLETTILVQIMETITSIIIITTKTTAPLKQKDHRISVTTKCRNLKEYQIITFQKEEPLKNEDLTKVTIPMDLENNKPMKEIKITIITTNKINNKKMARKVCLL